MPLTELVGMFKGKEEVSYEDASTFSDPFSRPDSDCVELVFENGQIMMQGKARKSPNSNITQAVVPRPQDSRNPNLSKMTKFSSMDPVMADFSLSVPSYEMGLDQDVDLVPWLNYPMEEPMHNDYTSDFLHEFSGVTLNDLPTEKHLGYRERKSSENGNDSSISLKHRNTSKVMSNCEKDNRGESIEVPKFLLPLQHSIPRSGVSNISGNSRGNSHHIASRDSTVNPSSLTAFTSLRLQKLDPGQPSSSSGISNFPYFSRPAALSRTSPVTVSPSRKLGRDDKRCILSGGSTSNLNKFTTLVNFDNGCSQKERVSHNQFIRTPANENSEALPAKPTEEVFSANQPLQSGDITRNYEPQNQPCDTPMNKVGAILEMNIEPVIATSSVCSANSAEIVSDEPACNLKRKSRETAESSGPSEEDEEESVGAKKRASARPGSKRSRAAEVHSLSERRRRDRINEKMRALQDLIPNSNKADKASMLDEAIEYLKSLQLQLQVLSMSAGMYVQPMMLPPGLQPIHGTQMQHYAPMGLEMGLGMGYGMNMVNINNGAKMVAFQGQYYPVLGTGSTFPGMLGSTLQAFLHPGQGLPMSMQQAPVVPAPLSAGLLKIPIGLNASSVAGTSNSAQLTPPSDQRDSHTQAIPKGVSSNYLNQETHQGSNEGNQQSVSRHDQHLQKIY